MVLCDTVSPPANQMACHIGGLWDCDGFPVKEGVFVINVNLGIEDTRAQAVAILAMCLPAATVSRKAHQHAPGSVFCMMGMLHNKTQGSSVASVTLYQSAYPCSLTICARAIRAETW